MSRVLTTIGPSFKALWKDKISFLLTIIPILIGLLLYLYLGKTFFTSTSDWGQRLVQDYVSEGGFGTFLVYAFKILVAILMYFFVNFTFVLVVSLLASPFNDLLSRRIEKKLLNEKLPSFADSIESLQGRFFTTIFNEVKKIIFILFLSLIAFVMAYIPFIAPISIIIGMILLAVEYLDYSWSRHNLAFIKCLSNLKQNFLSYTLGGGFFFLLISIPLVNLIVPAYGTSFFTYLWVNNNEHSDTSSRRS